MIRAAHAPVATRAEHAPVGSPCKICKLPLDKHRPSHNPQGNPCKKCGVAAYHHRVKHVPDGRGPRGECSCGVALSNHKIRAIAPADRRNKNARTYEDRQYTVGIDGEGQGETDHRYMLLAASDETGQHRRYIEAPPDGRLGTEQCLDFLLDLPNTSHAFAYAFGYDLTKILTDVDNETLYKLFRPELRKRPPFYRKGRLVRPLPAPVAWKGYSLNLVGSRFTVEKDKRSRVVWDVFKFFQGAFVNALLDWKVGENDVLVRMREMKAKRRQFDKLTRDQIRSYCFDEVAYMATLADKLTDAHADAGLELKSYFGAGSSAGAMLDRMGIKDQVRTGPEWIELAVASAFFGGRFENSIVGPVKGPIYSWDISSAYPYQLTFLPCLDCGKWRHTTDRKDIDGATTACVRYRLGPKPAYRHHETPADGIAWGPFPFRLKDGTITFPATSGGGWIWRDEYLAGERLFSHVEFEEAWIYETTCKHRPFAEIPEFYKQRLKLGKEGPGLVIKLGMNSCYGKLAQSIGDQPPFQSWIWAGMITSGTRAQLLDLIALHKNPANVLMVATDGAYSREVIKPPQPRDTGTSDTRDLDGNLKPLGGWEMKVYPKGVFAARPGIYFPLDPTEEEIKQVRARGIGRAVMYDSWREIVRAWKEGLEIVRLANVPRFWGAKSSIAPKRLHKATATPAQVKASPKEWIGGLVRATTKPGVAIDGDPRVIEGQITNVEPDKFRAGLLTIRYDQVHSLAVAADEPRPGQIIRTENSTFEGESLYWRVLTADETRRLELVDLPKGSDFRLGITVLAVADIASGKQPLIVKGHAQPDRRKGYEGIVVGKTKIALKHVRMIAVPVPPAAIKPTDNPLTMMVQLDAETSTGIKFTRAVPFGVSMKTGKETRLEVSFWHSVEPGELWEKRRRWAFTNGRVILHKPHPEYREGIEGKLELSHGRLVVDHGPRTTIDDRFDHLTLYGDLVYFRSAAYGQWRDQPIDLSFDPLPKREHINPDGTLAMRSFSPTTASAPYNAAVVSREARELKAVTQIALEQPDLMQFDYEDPGDE